MPAFEGAVALGYRHLEADVNVTSDWELVAFHDEALDRATDRSGLIRELPWREVKAALVDGREPIPRFDELLAAFPDTHFNIDPKHDSSVDALAAALRRTDALDRVCLGAFDDARLRRLRGMLGPRLCTSLGPRGTARVVAASRHIGRPQFAAGCTQVPTT